MVMPWEIPPVDPLGAPALPPPPPVGDASAAMPDLPPWLLAAAGAQNDVPPPPGAPPPVASELAGAPPVRVAAPAPPPAAPPTPPPPVSPKLAGAPGGAAAEAPPYITPDRPAPAAGPAQSQGMQPQEQEGPPVSARLPGGSLAEEQASIGRSAELDARQQEALAQGEARRAEYERAAIRDAQIREMKRRDDLAQREAQLEAERKAIASTPIDEHQWWNSKTEGQHAIAYISAFLGGQLSIWNGGRNDFTDWMQQQVAQNLETQKANIARRQGALEQGENMYAKLLARYGDERVADQMFMAANYDAIGHQAGAQAAQYNAPKARETGTQMQILAAKNAKIASDAAARAQQELALRKQEVGIHGYEARTGRMGAELAQQREGWDERVDVAKLAQEYEKMGMEHDAAIKKAEAEAKNKGIEGEKWEAEKKARAIYMPNGKPLLDKAGNPVLLGNPELAAKQREQLDNTWAFRRELTEYLDIMHHAGNEFSGVPGLSSTDAHARAEQLYADMMLKTKNSAGTGALDKGMVEVFNQFVAPPKEWLNSSNPEASAQQGLASWKENTNNRYRMQYGYEGNFVDDWDAMVTPEKNAPATSPYLKAQQEKSRKITEDSYDATYPGPTGPPKPLGVMPAERERPDELTRDRKKPAAPSPDDQEVDARTTFVENYMTKAPVVLRTQHGNVKVPRGSVSEDNAMALSDGSFASLHDKPKALPSGLKPVKWQDASNRDLDHAEDLFYKQQGGGK
jgi:hypothetical protein